MFGLGPIGQMAARIAKYRGARTIAVDSVPERVEMARRHGIEVIDASTRSGGPVWCPCPGSTGAWPAKRWTPEILPSLTADDPLGVDDLKTHTLPLSEAAHGYDVFERKADGAIKVVLKP